MQSLKEKMACAFKYDMKNLVNFLPNTQKSETFTPIGYFFPKYMRFELEKREELSLMALSSDAKVEKP